MQSGRASFLEGSDLSRYCHSRACLAREESRKRRRGTLRAAAARKGDTGTSISLFNRFVFLYLIMTKSDPGQSCFACPFSTENRKMIAITIILLVAILSPVMARAGIIIEQRITVAAPGAPGSVQYPHADAAGRQGKIPG